MRVCLHCGAILIISGVSRPGSSCSACGAPPRRQLSDTQQIQSLIDPDLIPAPPVAERPFDPCRDAVVTIWA
ncbi:MAG: hypothetical protein N2C14_33215 [Planctomycetales bacterium]